MREKRFGNSHIPTCFWCRCPLPLGRPENFIEQVVMVGDLPALIQIHKGCIPHYVAFVSKSA